MKTKIPQLAHLSLATLALGLMFAPNAQAAIWFDNEAGDLDFGNATNWNTNQLPSVGGNGNAFIGASGGAGGCRRVQCVQVQTIRSTRSHESASLQDTH